MNDDNVYSEISEVDARLRKLRDEANQKAIEFHRQALIEEGKAAAYEKALYELAQIEFPQ